MSDNVRKCAKTRQTMDGRCQESNLSSAGISILVIVIEIIVENSTLTFETFWTISRLNNSGGNTSLSVSLNWP